MSTEPINYEAVISDLEAKIAHLQATLAGIKVVAGMSGLGIPPSPSGPGTPSFTSGKVAPDAFLGKSIPEAAKVHLSNVRRKLSTQELMEAMEAGGLPGSKYQTVYAVLSRRENKVGDIVNVKGDWALAEWYPNYTKKAKKNPTSEQPTGEDSTQGSDGSEEEDEAATA